jgi:DNA-binding response OmpR family regulator
MKLLIVEDNPQLVANVFEYFEARGHVMDAAPDGLTGLHLASSQDYDAIILDWMLPRMDGPTLVKRLRVDVGKRTPIIMLTARDDLDDKISGFHAGADDYLTKPFALPELEVRLAALVARSAGNPVQRSKSFAPARRSSSIPPAANCWSA